MVTSENDKMTTLPEDEEESKIVTACNRFFICNSTEDHIWNSLTEKDKPSWCVPKHYGGVRCQGKGCVKVFVDKVVDPERDFKPSLKKPIHVCPNHKVNCTFGICHSCFKKQSEKGFAASQLR